MRTSPPDQSDRVEVVELDTLDVFTGRVRLEFSLDLNSFMQRSVCGNFSVHRPAGHLRRTVEPFLVHDHEVDPTNSPFVVSTRPCDSVVAVSASSIPSFTGWTRVSRFGSLPFAAQISRVRSSATSPGSAFRAISSRQRRTSTTIAPVTGLKARSWRFRRQICWRRGSRSPTARTTIFDGPFAPQPVQLSARTLAVRRQEQVGLLAIEMRIASFARRGGLFDRWNAGSQGHVSFSQRLYAPMTPTLLEPCGPSCLRRPPISRGR